MMSMFVIVVTIVAILLSVCLFSTMKMLALSTKKMDALLEEMNQIKKLVREESEQFKLDTNLAKLMNTQLVWLKDSIAEELHNMRTVTIDTFDRVFRCMEGVDKSTRDMLVNLKDAVERNDVDKLAEVMRYANILIRNFDNVNGIKHDFPTESNAKQQSESENSNNSEEDDESSDDCLKWEKEIESIIEEVDEI